jgi:hypothetical protein
LLKTSEKARKRNVINAYSLFLKFQGLTWDKPKCQAPQKFPFIPTEAEVDSLTSGTKPNTATFLRLLKETAMRCGEGSLWGAEGSGFFPCDSGAFQEGSGVDFFEDC